LPDRCHSTEKAAAIGAQKYLFSRNIITGDHAMNGLPESEIDLIQEWRAIKPRGGSKMLSSRLYSAAAYIEFASGILMGPSILRELRAGGRGPQSCFEPDLNAWLAFAFQWYPGWKPGDPGRGTTHRFGPAWTPASPTGGQSTRANWLYMSSCPHRGHRREQLVAWGAEVRGPFYLPIDAALSASQDSLDAALLEAAYGLEAAVTIAEILAARGIPFLLLCDDEADIPAPTRRKAAVLTSSCSMEMIRWTIRHKLPGNVAALMGNINEAAIELPNGEDGLMDCI
jgi:hypothetical protein